MAVPLPEAWGVAGPRRSHGEFRGAGVGISEGSSCHLTGTNVAARAGGVAGPGLIAHSCPLPRESSRARSAFLRLTSKLGPRGEKPQPTRGHRVLLQVLAPLISLESRSPCTLSRGPRPLVLASRARNTVVLRDSPATESGRPRRGRVKGFTGATPRTPRLTRETLG